MNPEEVSAEEEQSAAPNPPIYTCQTLLNVQTQQEASQALTPKYMKCVVFVCFGLSGSISHSEKPDIPLPVIFT